MSPGLTSLLTLRFAVSPRVAASLVEAGAILGIKQHHVSALMRNRSGNFSVSKPELGYDWL